MEVLIHLIQKGSVSCAIKAVRRSSEKKKTYIKIGDKSLAG